MRHAVVGARVKATFLCLRHDFPSLLRRVFMFSQLSCAADSEDFFSRAFDLTAVEKDERPILELSWIFCSHKKVLYFCSSVNVIRPLN